MVMRAPVLSLLLVLSLVAGISSTLAGCALPAELRPPEEFVSAFDEDVENEVSLGLQAAQKGRFTDAEFSFRKALVAMPDNERLQLNLATALGRQQLFGEAEQIYKSLLEKTPESLVVRAGLANLYADELKYDKAEMLLEQIIEETDEEPGKFVEPRMSAYRSLAALSFRKGFEEEATCYSSLAASLKKGNINEQVRHARLLMSRGLLDLLDDELGEVDPNEAPEQMSHQLALFRFEQGRTDDARLICEELVSKPTVDATVEGDCLWILALTKNFKIVSTDSGELDDNLRVRGFELSAREYSEGGGSLFSPESLTERIIAAQQEVLANSENKQMGIDQLTLFAHPDLIVDPTQAAPSQG